MEQESKKMQVKVLYSFNNNNTVFLSRSSGLFPIRVATIPGNNEEIMLGGYELKDCIQQVLKNSPENFQLATEDYAVYYKDLTEQPDEPFVSNGVFSDIVKNNDSILVPGRVCQNVSASFLFGNKKENSLTLEIRLKFHTIERANIMSNNNTGSANESNQNKINNNSNSDKNNISNSKVSNNFKRPNEYDDPKTKKLPKYSNQPQPVKATRTKSLPVYNQPFNHVFNIRNADKMNTPSRYDSQSVQNRFKLAPFLDAQALDKPKVLRRRRNDASRAVRTRSMISTRIISSPIHEEQDDGDDTDDTEYNENSAKTVEGADDDEDDDDDEEDEAETGVETSPYTPQQPPYKPGSDGLFEALPDLEDLDSKKTHMIHGSKLPDNHGLICINPNCSTKSSISWRYFEMDFQPHYLDIHKAEEFDKKNYDGMYGPLCNACYLFLRAKGFMRPAVVVKKYLKQQSYKKDKQKENNKFQIPTTTSASNNLIHKNNNQHHHHSNNNQGSSPVIHRFATPSHTPSEINQVIQNSKIGNRELNEFMNQLNNFGGPLTDIDLPEGVTPPMMATKSNTRVINLDEDKENCPPPDINQFNSSSSPAINGTEDFEKLIIKSFSKSSPLENDWMNIFNHSNNSNSNVSNQEGPTPKDSVVTPITNNNTTSNDDKKIHPSLPQMKTFTTRRSPRLNKIKNIPSSPPSQNDLELLEKEINDLKNSSPQPMASRNDTNHLVLSLYKNEVSSPSEVYETKTKNKT